MNNTNIAGLVIAKKHSSRFPNKNIAIFQGIPLFWHSISALKESQVSQIFVATDSKYIEEYCIAYGIPPENIIFRGPNASRDDDKLINIIRYVYYNLYKSFDIIVSVMANCPGNTGKDIDLAIERLKKHNLKEVRSFNDKGEENGILVLRKDLLETNQDISYYIGSVTTGAIEVHQETDLIKIINQSLK